MRSGCSPALAVVPDDLAADQVLGAAECGVHLDRERVKTLSGEGRWTENRVKHARRTARYAAAEESDRLESLGLTPIPRNAYLYLSEFWIQPISGHWIPAPAASSLVIVPIGTGFRPLGQEASALVRSRLRAGKTAILLGSPDLPEIATAAG